jgi:hypothetical protein
MAGIQDKKGKRQAKYVTHRQEYKISGKKFGKKFSQGKCADGNRQVLYKRQVATFIVKH